MLAQTFRNDNKTIDHKRRHCKKQKLKNFFWVFGGHMCENGGTNKESSFYNTLVYLLFVKQTLNYLKKCRRS